MNRFESAGARIALGALGLLLWGASWAEAGLWQRRRAARAAATTVAVPVRPTTTKVAAPPPPRPVMAAPVPASYQPSAYPMLGTFYPSPWLMVRGNWPAGGGYSPLGIFGDASMAVNGPLSPFRFYTAPVATYERGYNGSLISREGYSFSTPNRPEATPVVYPTQANYYYRIRGEPGEPPWWTTGMDWIDQN
jgi:hypothetical protein